MVGFEREKARKKELKKQRKKGRKQDVRRIKPDEHKVQFKTSMKVVMKEQKSRYEGPVTENACYLGATLDLLFASATV